jgi:hypothetical protein
LNMVSPFARFAVCGGSVEAGTTAGSVRIQTDAIATIAQPAIKNSNVRSRDT